MKYTNVFLPVLTLLVSSQMLFSQDILYHNEFPIRDVEVLDGVLKHAQDLNVHTLLQYDCDRLLAPYLKEAGLEPKAPSYPNWDGLDGHVGGHYLSAMAMNAARGDGECRSRMEYMIRELKAVREANDRNHPEWGTGYVGGVPNSAAIWSSFRKGDFSLYKGSWAPFYNLHKMFAGLRDAYVYGGSEDARSLFLGFCDWALSLTENLTDEQMQDMLSVEHGGINESLADAYTLTGDEKYLKAAERYSHHFLLDMMAHRTDALDNIHANTQVPKAVGFERISELSGNEYYHKAASFFWETVTGNRSLAFGGNSRREHFPSRTACADFIRDIDGPESCNTYNMLKLTEDLFRRSPQGFYADWYERALFNHILSTQHPEHGGYVYFTSGRPRHYRNYSAPNEAMWCCVGTGMENHGKYGQFIYTHSGDALYVNLFVPSRLSWREKGVTVEQNTAFPYGEKSKITIAEGNREFTLMVRYPGWVAPGAFAVSVNGVRQQVESGPSSYVGITRKWRKGDVVEISFPMHGSVEYLPQVPDYIALMYGPVLLGMKTGTEDLAHLVADDSRFGQYASGAKLPLDQAPILIDDDVDGIASKLEPVPGKPMHFSLGVRMENRIDGELQPFFEIHDSRYMMYWLALSTTGYEDYLKELTAEERDRMILDSLTVDKVQPGEQQPEVDHQMETDGSFTGVTDDVLYRDARDGHSFSYLLSTGGTESLSLRLKYWGVCEWKTNEFDIFIDDVLLTSVNNTYRWRESEFKYETYAVPSELVAGKKQVRVRFQAHPGKQIGQIYEVRLVRGRQ